MASRNKMTKQATKIINRKGKAQMIVDQIKEVIVKILKKETKKRRKLSRKSLALSLLGY